MKFRNPFRRAKREPTMQNKQAQLAIQAILNNRFRDARKILGITWDTKAYGKAWRKKNPNYMRDWRARNTDKWKAVKKEV